MGAEDEAGRRQRRWWTETETVDWSLGRQEPRRSVWPWLARGQWTSLASPTVCRPCCRLVVLLAVLFSLCSVRCFLLCCFSLVVVGLLLFYSFCCSPLFCVLDLFCAAARIIIIILRASAHVFRLALCAWFVESRL